MTPQDRYIVVQTLLDQERIRMALGVLRNVETRSAEEITLMMKARDALGELILLMDVRA